MGSHSLLPGDFLDLHCIQIRHKNQQNKIENSEINLNVCQVNLDKDARTIQWGERIAFLKNAAGNPYTKN